MPVSTLSISFLSLVLCVSAASHQPFLAPRQVARRQVSIASPPSPPSQCTSACSPVNNEISLGCPVTACCTTTFETQYYNCLECVGMALDASNYSTAQNSLNLLYTTCVDMGFVLPRLELPGQTATSSGASATTVPSSATGAAIGGPWRRARAEALIGAAVLLGVTTLW